MGVSAVRGSGVALSACMAAMLVSSSAASLDGCSPSRASGNVTGTWTGTTEAEGAEPTPLRLEITENEAGVTASVRVLFPGGAEYFEVDSVTGTRTGDALHLVGTTGLVIDVTQSGAALTGSVTFPRASGVEPAVVARLRIARS